MRANLALSAENAKDSLDVHRMIASKGAEPDGEFTHLQEMCRCHDTAAADAMYHGARHPGACPVRGQTSGAPMGLPAAAVMGVLRHRAVCRGAQRLP